MTGTRSLHRIFVHAGWEFRLNIRNGEQLLLLIVIPLIVLFALTQTSIIGGEQWSIQRALAASLSISTLAAGFTSLAISTAFERRSGSLLAVGTTPLSRIELVVGKGLSIFLLALVSSTVLYLVALVIGLKGQPQALLAIPTVLLGVLSVSGVAFLLAGTCRAELVLALANGLFVIAMIFGGIVFQFSAPLQTFVEAFPPSAIYSLMAIAFDLNTGVQEPGISPVIVLITWALVGNFAAARFFRWR